MLLIIDMTFDEARTTYWKYYISLENQFLDTERYVEFDYINNGKSYSIEYLKLFQAVCSEVDVVGKVLADILDPSFATTKVTGINEWWYHVSNSQRITDWNFARIDYNDIDVFRSNNLVERKCNLLGKHILQPWKNFNVIINPKLGAKKYILDTNVSPKAKTPSWWNDYNSVKHNRTGQYEKHSSNFAKANLKNLFWAFSGLYSLEVALLGVLSRNYKECLHNGFESRLFYENLSFYTYVLNVS